MSGPSVLVDWALAERLSVAVAGGGTAAGDPAGDPFGQRAVDAVFAEARDAVLAQSLLEPRADLPAPIAIDRAAWVRGALGMLEELAADAETRLAEALVMPGPLGRLARSLIGSGAAVEAGLVVGYAGRKILGQYELSVVDDDRPPRLLFVSPNLAAAHQRLGESSELFLRWIALHEVTHAVQFAAVPWLRGYLSTIVRKLVEAATEGLPAGELARRARSLIGNDPRKLLTTLLRGGVVRALTSPEQARHLDALQAAMTMVEGHAEHVMDAAGTRLDPAYGRLRERLESQRAARHPLDAILARLLGLDLKLRQYKLGKEFCDAVVAEAGVTGLNRVWAGSDALPSLAELERPAKWLERIAAPAAA